MFDLNGITPSILIVDDEKEELAAYKFLLESMGLNDVQVLEDSRKTLTVLRTMRSPIVFLDLNMPHKPGKEVLTEIKAEMPHVPVIICTANSELETAVQCLKLGAHDYLVKPITMNTFGSALRNASEIGSLRSELISMKNLGMAPQGLRNPSVFADIVTQSPIMTGIFQYIESVAESGQPVLILGETGVGKELVARAIHSASGLQGGFVAVDVSGLDDSLFSDTLFGHARGAYTGADTPRPGLLERAAGGTIFLDEIGDLNETSQVKLLRLLQERIYYPLGSDKPKNCTARILTATNKKLSETGASGGFRRDLYYRLSTHLIRIPSLNERKDDIPIIAEKLAFEAARGMGKPVPVFTKTAIDMLKNHTYPGNIRELKTYIFDAVARSGEVVEDRFLAERLGSDIPCESVRIFNDCSDADLESIFGHFPTLDEVTQHVVSAALERCGGNQSQASKLLGISKQALNKRVQKRSE